MEPTGKALANAIDGLVILVDWGLISNCNYTRTVSEIVPSIGYYLAQVISSPGYLGLDPSKIELIGHGLGGHIAGYAGAALNGAINKITGKYPAVFDEDNFSERIYLQLWIRPVTVFQAVDSVAHVHHSFKCCIQTQRNMVQTNFWARLTFLRIEVANFNLDAPAIIAVIPKRCSIITLQYLFGIHFAVENVIYALFQSVRAILVYIMAAQAVYSASVQHHAFHIICRQQQQQLLLQRRK